ncbi:sideroflexin-4 isoform 2-T2 [Rhynchonycteris naso]
MEPNVRFWITERQSFIQRVLQWTELLDPTNLVVSIGKVEKSRQLLLTNEDASIHDLEDQRVFLSLLSVKSLKSMILPQLSLSAYSTVFNTINGNASYNRGPYESLLLGAGVIASTTFFGLFPRLLLMRYPVKNFLLRETFPIIVFAHVSGMNVAASRSFEPMRGIEVMDREGNVIGYSRKAGTKAIRDTATSRIVLFGTSALIPEIFSFYFKRTQLFTRYPHSLWTLKLSCTILVMGLMVPVSFSMFPQIQRIESSKLEMEIQSATEETELFYNRGV